MGGGEGKWNEEGEVWKEMENRIVIRDNVSSNIIS